MPIRVCAHSTCPNPATRRSRCTEHATQQDRQANRAGYRIYRTAKWQRTRRRYLFEHPLCGNPELA